MKKDIRLIAGLSLIAGYIFFVAVLFTPLHSVRADIYNPGSGSSAGGSGSGNVIVSPSSTVIAGNVPFYTTSGSSTLSSTSSASLLGAALTIGGTQSSTIKGDGTKTQIPNLDNVLFADSFPGSDIAAQVMNAIASSTSLNPVVYITASSSFSTTLSLTTSTMGGVKNPLIICAGGVNLTYTGSGTSTIINVTLGAQPLWGIIGCKFTGTNNTGTGIQIGGNAGANNLTLYGNKWTLFNLGVEAGANVNWLMFDSNVVNFNTRSWQWDGGANSGEGIFMTRNLFADGTTITSSSLAKCVYFSGALGDYQGFANHYDDCGRFVDTGGIQNDIEIGSYFENPNASASSGYPGYAMYTIASSSSGMHTLSGGEFKNDAQGATSTPNAPIVAGDTLNVDGVTFDRNGAQKWNYAIDQTPNNSNINVKSVLNQNSSWATNFIQGFSGVIQNSSILLAANDGRGLEVVNTNATQPSFFDVSSSGGTLISNNVSGGGSTQTVTSSPAWRFAFSQLSDNVQIQRSPATTTYNPTTLFTMSNIGGLTLTGGVIASGTITFKGPNGLTSFGMTSTGVPLVLGTTTAAAIGGASLAIDACTSTTSVFPYVLSTSTDIFITQPQVNLNPAVFAWNSYISSLQAGSSTVTTQICAELAAGATPTSTKFNVSVTRVSGM